MKLMLSAVLLASLAVVQPVVAQSSPEAAVKQFKAAVDKGKADEMLALLPPSYVKDATGLVNEFGKRMDVEIWAKLRDTLGKAATALGPKAALFVDMASGGETVTPEVKAARTKALGAAIGALGTLAKSDFMSLDQLKKTDAKVFAKEIGATFAATTAAMKVLDTDDPKEEDGQFKILKSEKLPSGNVALTFADKDGGEGETQEFTQVEGRWVPADMAEGWADGIKEARASLAKMDFTTPAGQQQKAQFLGMMGMVDPMVQQFGTAQTPEQLQQMLGGLMMPLMMMGGAMGGGAGMGAPVPMQ